MSTAKPLPTFNRHQAFLPRSIIVDHQGTPWWVGDDGTLSAPRVVSSDGAARVRDEQPLVGNNYASQADGMAAKKLTFSSDYIQDAIDRDRIRNFLTFARTLDPDKPTVISGTSAQVLSIAKALTKAGYHV